MLREYSVPFLQATQAPFEEKASPAIQSLKLSVIGRLGLLKELALR